jgi:SNF2 family DNA or RNA helicase
MTVVAESFEPVRELPNGQSVWSPLGGLFDFQAEHIAEAYVRTETQQGLVAVWDTGLGKTWLAMVLAAYLFEDGKIDLAIVVSEKNKLTDWRDDFERYTTLSAHRYHGTGRQKRLTKAGLPQVLCTTYETGRNELMQRAERVPGKRGRGAMEDGPLVDTLGLRGKRVLWVFDEVTKLKNRSSELHQAYNYILGQLRKGPSRQRVIGLTATPSERDYSDAYNVGRIVCPEKMPTVTEFERVFTRGVDSFGHLVFRRDRANQFAALFQDIILRKRKSDPDVVEQFPRQIEKSVHVAMNAEHAKFYRSVQEILQPADGEEETRSSAQIEADELRMFTLLRMTAGHPAAHIHKDNPISLAITEAVGPKGLMAITSSKTERLIELLKPLVKGQGAQVVVFTEYGGSVLLEIARELRDAGFSVSEYHGGRSLHANDDSKNQFIKGNTEILLASDAASRGMNLKNAEYVVNYELPVTFSRYQQRINRVHRIDSDKPICTAYSLVLEGTLEEQIMHLFARRNTDHDVLLGDEEDETSFISARERRTILAA